MFKKMLLPHPSIIPIIVSGIIIFYLFLEYILGIQRNRNIFLPYYGRKVSISGILVDDAGDKEKTITIKINNISINNSTNCTNCQAYAELTGVTNTFARSDRIEMSGIIKEGFANYDIYIDQPALLAHDKPDPPDFAVIIRNKIKSSLSEFLSEKENGLALGYLFGDKNAMSGELTNEIRLAGLSHLVVTSGFHLSILINIIRRLFGKISRIAMLFAVIASLLTFISLAGFSASMARAGLMSLMSVLAWYFGRKFHPGRLIVYSAAITLLINPNNISNIGWQLSFASYTGIIFFAPVLTKYLYGSARPNYVSASLIVSISAQLFCLPLTIYYFGVFSIVGIMACLIIAPTISFLMLTICLSIILSHLLIPFLSSAFLGFTSLFLKLHLFIISAAAKIPWATIDISASNKKILLLYIPIIAILILLKKLSKTDFRPSYKLEKSPDYSIIYAC